MDMRGRVAALVSILGSAALGSAAVAQEEAEAPPPAPRENARFWERVYSGEKVLEVHFILEREDWDRMRPERAGPRPPLPRERGPRGPSPRPLPRDGDSGERPPRPGERDPAGPPAPPPRRGFPGGLKFEYVPATVVIDGEKLERVGLRFKGNSSFRSAGGSVRKPFKLDTDRFVEGQEFRGRSKLNFSNAFKDPSFLKEKLGYEIFRDAGLPTPGVGWARVHLTVRGLHERELVGLYVLIEQVGRGFLERHLGKGASRGLLMKPERFRDFEYLGDDPGAYEAYDIKVGEDRPELIRRFAAFLELIQNSGDGAFAARIGELLDLDNMAAYLAANALLVNLDSFVGTGHNFYLYLDRPDGKLRILPWDVNEVFGTFNLGNDIETLQGWNVRRPWATARRLLDRLFTLETFRERYETALAKLLAGSFGEKHLLERIDALVKIVTPYLEDDPHGSGIEGLRRSVEGGDAGAAGAAPRPRRFRPPGNGPAIKPFIRRRVESVKMQLAGEENGRDLRVRRFPPPRRRPGPGRAGR